MNFGSGGNMKVKAWRDVWGAGQGVGAVKAIQPAGAYVEQLATEYEAARRRIGC